MSGRRWITPEQAAALAAKGQLRDVTRIGKPLPGPHWTDNVEPVNAAPDSAHRKAAAVPPSGSRSGAAPILLPWPPTGNTAVRHANGAHYLRSEVVAYRQTVATLVAGLTPIAGQYTLRYEMSPPDARRRDADNAVKSLNDALVQCGYLPDDSMAWMRELVVTVDDERRGAVKVIARAIGETREAA